MNIPFTLFAVLLLEKITRKVHLQEGASYRTKLNCRSCSKLRWAVDRTKGSCRKISSTKNFKPSIKREEYFYVVDE